MATTEVLTFCGFCGATCSARATVEDGRIVKWEQEKEGGLHYLPCPSFKGRSNIAVNEDPDRLKYPLKRVGAKGEGKWQRISWDEAFDSIAQKLTELKEKYGPECVATGVGHPKGFEFPWMQRFTSAFGTPNCYTPLALCGAAGNAAGSSSYGPGHFGGAREGGAPPKLVIVWGGARGDKTGRDRERLRKQVQDGAKLVVIDPRRIVCTEDADLWIKPRPGSDSALAFGFLKVIIDEELYDKDFVEKWTVGFDKIQEEVKLFTLDDVERVTWVPKEQIQQVMRWYATLKPALLGGGMGSFGQGSRSYQGTRVTNILRAIVDHTTLPGWGTASTRAPYTPGSKIYLLDKLPRKIDGNVAAQHKYAVRTSYIPGVALVKGILQGKIKAAMFSTCEPLVSFPNSSKTYEALKKLELLVVLNIYMTPTTAMADFVLPAATNIECDTIDCFTGTQALHAMPKVADPPGEAMSDVMIINELAKRLGLGEYFFNSDLETVNYVIQPSGLTWEEVKKKRKLEGTTTERAEEGGYFTTPSGKMEIYSTRAKEVYDCNPLPVWKEVQPPWQTSEKYPLMGTSFAPEQFVLAAYRNVRNFRRRMPFPTVQLHPDVAHKIGATDGDWIWIESEVGRIMQKLIIDPEIDPRVVMCTYGWYYPEDLSNACQWDKSNVNVLISDEPVETASGSQDTRGFPVRVYKASQEDVGNLEERYQEWLIEA